MQFGQRSFVERLRLSFSACYRLLERPKTARWTVIVLLTIHTGLLAYSAYVHSPTLNEPGHLVAGLSHWRYRRFDLYSVNPPLVRMLATLPILVVGCNEDWSNYVEGPGERPVFGIGADFLTANGARSFWLITLARWSCIPFSLIGALVCFLWARDLYGRPSGVLACAFWCFSPNILAHASLMTPDAHATALGLAACYTFWRWLINPTWTQVALTGIIFGLAELAKTTLIIFYPLWPALWLAYRWSDRKNGMRARDWMQEASMLLLRMAIGLYVLNLGYGFEGSCKQLNEFSFVSNLFTGNKAENKKQGLSLGQDDSCGHTIQILPHRSSTNRFSNNWLGFLPVPFPENYILGIDLQQVDFEKGRPSYLRGVWRNKGWWYYYIYAAAIKVPVGVWLLGLFSLFSLFLRSHNNTLGRDELVLLFPGIVIFCVVSSKTGFSEHFRYVLPAFPFVFVFISRFLRNHNLYPAQTGRSADIILRGALRTTGGKLPVVAFFSCWAALSSLWIWPHNLAYFNETIGGPIHGPAHLLGSSVDWGQDVVYVQQWLINRKLRVVSLNTVDQGHTRILLETFNEHLDWPDSAGEPSGRTCAVSSVGAIHLGYNTYYQKEEGTRTRIGYTFVVRELEKSQ